MGRRWVSNFDYGEAWVETPEKISKAELPLIEEWFDIILKQLERTAVEEEEVRGS